MTTLLVSLCNAPPGSPALLAVDPDLRAHRPLAFGAAPPPQYGATGLALASDHLAGDTLYVALQEEKSPRVLLFDPAMIVYGPREVWPLPPAVDLHSLVVTSGGLFVVSTGRDEVLRVTTQPGQRLHVESYWSPVPNPEADTLHLNGLLLDRGELIVSALGPKDGQDFGMHGRLYRYPSKEPFVTDIRQPHSPLFVGERLLVCESATERVRAVGALIGPAGVVSPKLGGYTRGLAHHEGALYVATSPFRNCRGHGAGRAALHRLDARTLRPDRSLDLSVYGAEVYDVLVLP